MPDAEDVATSVARAVCMATRTLSNQLIGRVPAASIESPDAAVLLSRGNASSPDHATLRSRRRSDADQRPRRVHDERRDYVVVLEESGDAVTVDQRHRKPGFGTIVSHRIIVHWAANSRRERLDAVCKRPGRRPNRRSDLCVRDEDTVEVCRGTGPIRRFRVERTTVVTHAAGVTTFRRSVLGHRARSQRPVDRSDPVKMSLLRLTNRGRLPVG